MMLEHIKLNRIRGVGGSVLCALLLFPAFAGLVLIVRNVAILRLRNVPQVRLFGKVPLGSSLVWGFPLIAIGAIMCLGYFMGEPSGPDDLWLFLLVCLPLLLTGVLLAIYWAQYRAYKDLVEQTLRRIAVSPNLELDKPVIVQGFTWKPVQQKQLLEDLRDNDLITFEEMGGNCYRARIIHPDLLFYCKEVREEIRKESPVQTWNCPSCGAPNNSAAGVPCEYCGNVPDNAATSRTDPNAGLHEIQDLADNFFKNGDFPNIGDLMKNGNFTNAEDFLKDGKSVKTVITRKNGKITSTTDSVEEEE